MLESLDLFLKGVDRTIQLLNVRAEGRRRFFKEVIEPLFKELEPVVDDYLAFFASCKREIIEVPDMHFGQCVERLNTLRDEMLVARMRVRGLAQALREAREEDVRELAKHVGKIFESSEMTRPDLVSSTAFGMLNFLESGDAKNKFELLEHVREIRSQVELNWMKATAKYAALRIDSFR